MVLDLSGLRWVEVDQEAQVAHVGPGVLLWDLERMLEPRGLTTGLEPQSIRVASVGGLVSTLASGALQPGYGNLEDALLYVDIVTGDGVEARLGSPRRPRGLGLAGGPLLMAGAEGSLGVVVGVGLRLRRRPRHVVSATYAFPSVAAALRAARRLVQWSQPMLLRVLDEREAGLTHGASTPLAIVAYADDEDPGVPEALASKAERVALSESGRRARDAFEDWRRTRYSYGELVKSLTAAGLWFDTIDTQATWPVLPRLHRLLTERLEAARGVSMVFSHISHFYTSGGSLYTTMAVEQDPRALARAWRTAMEAALEAGASVTHHHGVGLQKLPWTARERAGELAVYCRLKAALDPQGVLAASGLPAACRRWGWSIGED